MSQITQTETAAQMGAVISLTGNSGGAVHPNVGGNINIIGSGALTVTGNPGTNTLTISGATLANSYVTNSGTAVPSGGVLNVLDSQGTAIFSGSGNTITHTYTSAMGLNTGLGLNVLSSLSGGTSNTVFGANSGAALTSGSNNTLFGVSAGNQLTNENANTAIGSQALASLTSNGNNTAIGGNALSNALSSNQCTAVGYGSFDSITQGNYNTGLGYLTGSSYTTTESSNILIGYNVTGTVAESNVLRIGAGTGSGNGQLAAAYISGIQGVNVGSVASVVSISGDKLGSTAITAGTGITVTPGANTITLATAGSVALSFATDSGTATPSAGVITIAGGSNMNTSGAGSTVTVNLDNTVSISGSMTAGTGFTATTGNVAITAGNLTLPNTNGAGTQGEITFGGSRFISNFGNLNTFVGSGSGNTTVVGSGNTGIGMNALAALSSVSGAQNNTSVGYGAGARITTGTNNTVIGEGAATTCTTGTGNCSLGNQTLLDLVSGSYNIAIGTDAGLEYTTSESSNVLLNSEGVNGESNVLRIGVATGTGDAYLAAAYICGINGVNVGSVASVVSINGDQLGTTTITAGTGITVTAGANTITISGSGTSTLNFHSVLVGASPYTVGATDDILGAVSSGGAITIKLPNAPSTGRIYTIKDTGNDAGTNNITVTTVGGTVTIDTVTSFVMNTNLESITVFFDGSNYWVM